MNTIFRSQQSKIEEQGNEGDEQVKKGELQIIFEERMTNKRCLFQRVKYTIIDGSQKVNALTLLNSSLSLRAFLNNHLIFIEQNGIDVSLGLFPIEIDKSVFISLPKDSSNPLIIKHQQADRLENSDIFKNLTHLQDVLMRGNETNEGEDLKKNQIMFTDRELKMLASTFFQKPVENHAIQELPKQSHEDIDTMQSIVDELSDPMSLKRRKKENADQNTQQFLRLKDEAEDSNESYKIDESSSRTNGVQQTQCRKGIGQVGVIVPRNTKGVKRSCERTIQEGIQLVIQWRDQYEECKNQNIVKDLKTVANDMGISKKTLDYYYLELRTAEFFGFSFDDNLHQRMGYLRNFIEEQTKIYIQQNNHSKIPRQLHLTYKLPNQNQISQNNNHFDYQVESLKPQLSSQSNKFVSLIREDLQSQNEIDGFPIFNMTDSTNENKEIQFDLTDQNTRISTDAQIFLNMQENYKIDHLQVPSNRDQIKENVQLINDGGYNKIDLSSNQSDEPKKHVIHPQERKINNIFYKKFLEKQKLSQNQQDILEE